MGISKRSSISRLPAEVRRHIERRLAEGGLTLDELIADLQREFPAHHDDLPSRSAVHRYGQKLERRLAAIRASTDAARIIREHAGDREDARSEALTAMIQSELFESILELQEASDEEMPVDKRVSLLSAAAKNIATLTRSSIGLKKYQEDIREAFAQEAAANVEKIAKEQGLTQSSIDAFKRGVLGIA